MNPEVYNLRRENEQLRKRVAELEEERRRYLAEAKRTKKGEAPEVAKMTECLSRGNYNGRCK